MLFCCCSPALDSLIKPYADKYISDGKKICGIVKSQAEDAIKRLLPSQPGMKVLKSSTRKRFNYKSE